MSSFFAFLFAFFIFLLASSIDWNFSFYIYYNNYLYGYVCLDQNFLEESYFDYDFIFSKKEQILANFSGEIFPTVFDRYITYQTLANDNEDTEMEFSQQKNILYKGRDSVVNGRFEYSFVVTS